MLPWLGRRAEEQLGYARALAALESLAEATGESVTWASARAPQFWSGGGPVAAAVAVRAGSA